MEGSSCYITKAIVWSALSLVTFCICLKFNIFSARRKLCLRFILCIDTEPILRDDAFLRQKALQPMVGHFQIHQCAIEGSVRVGLADM